MVHFPTGEPLSQLRASKFVQLTVLTEFFFSCYLTLFFRVHPRPIVLGLPAVTADETQWNEMTGGESTKKRFKTCLLKGSSSRHPTPPKISSVIEGTL